MDRRHGALLTISAMLIGSAAAASPPAAASSLLASRPAARAAGSIAKVRAIKRGLAVAPPRRRFVRGKVKQRLFPKYALRTGPKQLASVAFVDGTILHLNQRTDAVLRSPAVTFVSRGEVDQIVQPGTDHRITTAVATASAIGTEFDTRCSGRAKRERCSFVVVEGVIQVTGRGTTVTVKTGEVTTVRSGQAPTPPKPVDASSRVAWTRPLPPPPPTLGENIALDANGGSVVASSTRAGGTFAAGNLIDGDLVTGWQSAAGVTQGATLTFAFARGAVYRILGIVIDPAAGGGQAASNDLKQFTVSTSRDGGPFTAVTSAQTTQSDSLQAFIFNTPVDADRLQLALASNWGGPDGIAASEVEIIGERVAVATSAPTATPTVTSTPTRTPTPTATRTGPTATPTATKPTGGANRLYKLNIATSAQTYPDQSDHAGNTAVAFFKGQTCGPTPFTNSWTGTLTINEVLLDGSVINDPVVSPTFVAGPNDSIHLYGDGSGNEAEFNLNFNGSSATLTWDGIPAWNPSPPRVTGTGAITDSGPC